MSKPAASFRVWLLLAIAGVFSGFAWLAHIEPAHAVGVVVQSGPRLFTSSSSSSSGGIADGATVIRTGPSATMPNQEWLGGLGGYNDSASNGQTFSRTNWSLLTPGGGVTQKNTTEFTLNRATSYIADFRSSSTEYKQTRFFDTGVSGFSSMYVSYWMRANHDTMEVGGGGGGASIQHKIFRYMDVADVSDAVSGAYMSNWDGQNQGFFTNFRNASANQDVQFFDNSDGNHTDLPGGDTVWRRYEQWVVLNTALGTANGYFRVKVTTTAGATVVDNTYTNIQYRGSSDTGLSNYRYAVPQDYVGNATDNSHPAPDNGHAVINRDDEHFLWLTSGTGFPARAEIVNNAVYASSTIRRTCELVSISGTTWTVKVNLPFAAFGVTDATGLYLALFNSSGTPTMVILDATPALRVPKWLRSIDAANDDHAYQVAA